MSIFALLMAMSFFTFSPANLAGDNCDIFERIERAHEMLEADASDIWVSNEKSDFQEMYYTEMGKARTMVRRSPDYVEREVPLVLLNTLGCNLRKVTVKKVLQENILGTQPGGSRGTVVDGPVSGNGYIWWRVDFDTGLDGWVAGSLLSLSSGARSVVVGSRVVVYSRLANVRSVPGTSRYPVLVSNNFYFDIDLEERIYGKLWNWFNTPFRVFPEEWVVVGSAWKRQSGPGVIVYTPYSHALYGAYPELARAGQDYYEAEVREALEDLRKEGVRSRAVPGELLADVVERYFMDDIRLVPLLEHSDEQEFLAYSRGEIAISPFRRAQVIIGSNGNTAFNSTVSSAGAGGIVQIWPRTCRHLRANYRISHPRCGTPSNHRDHTHVESIKSAIAHFDDTLTSFVRAFGADIINHPDISRYQVAAYNGGAGRIIRAVRAYGDRWDMAHTNRLGRLESSSLRTETVIYVQKYDFLARNRFEIYP